MDNIKLFCNGSSCGKIFDRFAKEDGHKIMLSLEDSINEYVHQLKAVKETIDKLESMKKEWFFDKDTKIGIFWSGCYKEDENIKELTLEEAKKLYKEIKIKYDTLFELFTNAEKIHYKDNPGGLIDKYFTDIE